MEQTRLRKPPSSSLNQAIRLAQRGDAIAFEHIYRLHSRRVYSLCLRLVRGPVEAEDSTQKAFLQLFRKIHTFRGESAFSSWLYRSTANVAFMSFRKKRPATNSVESASETDNEGASTVSEIAVTDLRLSGLFDRINLQTAIEQLFSGYKAMFILHDVMDTNIRRSQRFLAVRLEIPNHNCTRRENDCVRSCALKTLASE
jgi:RNA polymerase sigma-70 factor (ECF subfamily)